MNSECNPRIKRVFNINTGKFQWWAFATSSLGWNSNTTSYRAMHIAHEYCHKLNAKEANES